VFATGSGVTEELADSNPICIAVPACCHFIEDFTAFGTFESEPGLDDGSDAIAVRTVGDKLLISLLYGLV
jgi:hypothetical protein